MSFMTPRRWAFSEMLRGLKRDGSRSLLSLLLSSPSFFTASPNP